MTAYLSQGVIGPWGNAPGNGNAHERGVIFECSVPGHITSLRWYRTDTNALRNINSIHLWHLSTGNLLASVDPAPDNGAAGWQEAVLGSPVAVTTGTRYAVGVHMPGASTIASQSFLWPGNPPSGVGYVEGFAFAYRQSTVPIAPTTGLGGNVSGVDVGYEIGTPFDPGVLPTSDDVLAILDAYFRADNDNGHQSSTPYLTWGLAQQAKDAADGASTAAAAAQASADANGTAIGGVSTQVAGVGTSVTTLLDRLSADLATLLNNASAGLVAWLNGAAADPTQWWTAFMAQFTRATGGSGFGGPDPMAGWTLQDTLEITDEAAWAQEADLYRLNLDSTGSLPPADPVAGVLVTYRLGWWSVLDGGFFRQRTYIDGPSADLVSQNGRMPGLVVFLNHGGHGTIEAWTKDT